MRKQHAILLSVMAVGVLDGPVCSKPITTEADLTAMISQLQQADTRFQAFMDLVEFGGYQPGNIVALNGLPDGWDQHLEQLHMQAAKAIDECPNLDGVIAEIIRHLDEPNRRLEMVATLLKFSADRIRQMGSLITVSENPKLDALKEKAEEAANQTADVKTVSEALTNTDSAIRKWGLQNFGNPLSQTEAWAALLPQIKKFASGDDKDLRGAAIGSLANFPGTGGFLDQRFAIEKSAFLLMSLLHQRDIWAKEFDLRFVPRMDDLLQDPDEAVRDEVLNFIGSNATWAEMYQVSFGKDVFERVIKSTQAQSAKERFLAVFALEYIRHIDPDATRKALLRLVNDPEQNVRWRLGYCLSDQRDREDVKQAIAALVKDKSAEVRMHTIIAVGAEKFMPELRELAHSPDDEIAKWASDQLKQIGDRYKPNTNDRF